ncbi:hypothetical protein N0U24_26320, partial [Peribacillus frigoritolerans]|nr:hypothetical protein [Peribacillus frigoritolerans]
LLHGGILQLVRTVELSTHAALCSCTCIGKASSEVIETPFTGGNRSHTLRKDLLELSSPTIS